MSSKSNEAVETSSTNVAMDQRVVVEDGNAISDSLIVSNDPAVVEAALRPLLGAWSEMLSNNSVNLVEVVDMGNRVIGMLDRSQVTMAEAAESTLREGVAMFEGLLGQNKLTVDLVEMTATRAFDTTDKAVEVLAEVQTGDFADLSKTIMFFALGMLLVSGWIVRE